MPYHHQPLRSGWVEVICGPMFSGKTEELLRRLRRALIARQKVQLFKPAIDNRYGATIVASHNGLQWQAVVVPDSSALLAAVAADATVIAVDEVQFFDE
ncbi:MAG: thymidine kinase, partial [Caldilineales bacterium]|nr:thymidine kinase [Caldilineales bacterium]